MIRQGFFILCLILCYGVSGWSQNVPEFPVYNQNLIPPSPEVASLARFADHNVSYATGRPGVSMPLYTIKSGSLVVPVSLDYSPGGLRVEEIASSAGLGWALSAGGMISRTVVGGADDHQGQGFLDNEQYAPAALKAAYASMPLNQQISLWNDISSGALDVEPDNYSFNLPGKSGKFTINGNDKKAYTLPFEKIDIKYERNGSGAFARWIVTTPDGIRYIFGERMALQEAFVESQENVRTDVRTQTTVTTTAWFLREMISANGADTIFFNYTAYNTNYCNQLSITKRLSPTNDYSCLPQEERSYSRTAVTGYIISEIVGRFGKVMFGYEDNRQDLHGGKRLQYVSVFNRANLQINKFELKHSYFLANQHAPTSAPPCPLNLQGAQDRKLKLDSLKEISRSGEVLVKTFGYDYNEQTGRTLPHRFSNAQDDWGFYNGVNNLTLVPRYPAYGQYDVNSFVLDGAVREPSESFTKIGSLTSIHYPTGGHTNYEYELNETWAADFLHEVSLPDENIPYIDYARIESNTILDPAFPGFVLESAPFTVNSSLYKRQFSYFKIGFDHPNYQNAGCDFDERGEKPCRITVTLLDVNNNVITSVAPGSMVRLLLNNTYKLRMLVAQKTQWAEDAVAYVRGPAEQDRFYNKKVGGLRIKTITDFDGSALTPSLKKEYKYLDGNDNTKSSGKLNLFPSYHSTVHYNNQNPMSPCVTNTAAFQRTANSVVPLSTFSGSSVVYSRVEAYQVGNSNDRLKSVFHFTDEMDDWGSASFFPFPPSLNLEHRRGLPILEEHFKQTATGYEIVSSKQTQYKPLCIPFGTSSPGCPNSKEHFGIKFSPYGYTIPGTDGNPNSGYDLYRIWSEWVAPEEITERTYSSSTVYLEKKTLFSYENPVHGQITQVKTFESDATMSINDFKYSDDYGTVTPSADPQATAIRQMQDKKALLPVEKLVVKEDQNGGKKIIAGSIAGYRPNSFLLDALYVLDVPGSIPFSSFTKSSVNGSGLFVKDSRYRRIATFQTYDVFGNATDTKKEDDVPYGYIYDYNGLYPVCQVTGATSVQIAFTSFEAENKGRWEYSGAISDGSAATGTKYYNLTTGSPASAFVTIGTQYIVSYWNDQSSAFAITGGTAVSYTTKSGPAGWYYHEHVITATGSSVSVSGNGKLDELRLYPKGSLMNTYTYIPLLGMLSQCDNNNRISYYEYDASNRLSIIRDQDRNVLKKFCYNYVGQVEECGIIVYSSQAATGSFTRANCGAGGTGATVTYSVPAGTYTSTVSQIHADQQAFNDVNTNGQAYADATASCSWVNVAQSGSFTRNNCGTGTPGTVSYTISAGTYSSNISQADADQQAINALNAGGQSYANSQANCTWSNVAQSGSFTRNNCGAGATAGSVSYSISANTYSSHISQADADQQAINALDAQGQANANTNGTCTWYSAAQSATFTRNNCAPGGVGGTANYSISAGQFSSGVSQTDADQQAINALNSQGQSHANSTASCTWYNAAQTATFTRNNCGSGGIGASVSYTIAANTYNSTTSQADADQQAITALNAQGQDHANSVAGCTWYNVEASYHFIRNNCPPNYTGSTVIYTVPANTYSSIVSFAAAQQQATNDANSNGQNYANANGNCVSNCDQYNCSGNDRKCINGVCEIGVKVYTASTLNREGTYTCIFHYEFSDGTWSPNYVETSPVRCNGGGPLEP